MLRLKLYASGAHSLRFKPSLPKSLGWSVLHFCGNYTCQIRLKKDLNFKPELDSGMSPLFCQINSTFLSFAKKRQINLTKRVKRLPNLKVCGHKSQILGLTPYSVLRLLVSKGPITVFLAGSCFVRPWPCDV